MGGLHIITELFPYLIEWKNYQNGVPNTNIERLKMVEHENVKKKCKSSKLVSPRVWQHCVLLVATSEKKVYIKKVNCRVLSKNIINFEKKK